MGSGFTYCKSLIIICLFLTVSLFLPERAFSQTIDTTQQRILKLRDTPNNSLADPVNSPLFLDSPSNIKRSIIYDPATNEYTIYHKMGNYDFRRPVTMSAEQYRSWEYEQSMREYWEARLSGDEQGFRSSLIPQIEVGGETFDKIFGSNVINIIPQGSAELIFGINISRTQNPTLSEKLQTIPTFDFQEKIQMNVTGTIGDKMQLGVNYNTDAMFEFENRTKLEYAGKEDEIIKKIEAGDVTLPLSGTLITGSHSLFGLKTEMQFGKLTVTTVLSQQKGESSVVELKGGAQVTEYEVFADEYEANRHFFLSHYFRDTYDNSLKALPLIASGITIERIEIWVTNKTSRFEDASNRNIVAFMDLGEHSGHIYNSVPAFAQLPATGLNPGNSTNGMYGSLTTTYQQVRNVDQVTNVLAPLYPGFQIGRDFEKIENARKLNEREYTLNNQLGYISLNVALNNDEVLAVAYEYTFNGQVFKVGEFSTDGITAPEALLLKLIKGTTLSPSIPTWDLMMKNVYALGALQVENRNFELHVLYLDDNTGNLVNYLPDGPGGNKLLLQMMRLDNLNNQLDPKPDGVFDFIEGITILPSRGRVIFPVVEPFGSHLASQLTDPKLISKYVYSELYDSTQTVARQNAEKNKFRIAGTYSSTSGSEIMLNKLNIPQGSVKVTAGGVPLAENIDYTVDYNMGRVSIINQALIESQTPIQVSLESNQFFGFQTKTLVGTHLDYRVSNNFNIGATILHLNERPYTQKVVFGEEPISNTIWGVNTSYRTQSVFLTNMIDKLPFIETKAPSTITFFGEFANLVPGHSRAISKTGNSYIDDFEASEIPLDMKSFNAWVLASVPQGQDALFPEASLNNDLASGYNRARLAWYVIDPLFLRNGSATPAHIKANSDLQSSHFVREIFETEIFPFKESPSGIPTNLAVLNLGFYPSERGPYNFDTDPGAYSRGLEPTGRLRDPRTRWAGIMREVLTSDFEAANIQYIKFWMMDPFVENPTHTGGDFYLNLGNISEDILRDSRKSFENGLPTSEILRNVDSTAWGRVPTIQAVVHAFDNSPDSRRFQDVGLDGLSNSNEERYFEAYLARVAALVAPNVLTSIIADPAADDFHYYRGSDYDAAELGILERYKRYNGLEGNSPTSDQSAESYPASGSTLPDMEDINRDNTLNETESYYQYRISMRPQDMVVGSNYIVDEIEYNATLANGQKSKVKWYQFKVPVTEYENIIGSIRDFKSIRFMRMFMRNFDEDVVLRIAKLDLVRAEWRKYNISIIEGGERVTIPETDDPSFEISSVSIEENAGKEPVNYVLPPGFDRIVDPQNPQLRQLNEQSMVLRVKNLGDGDARAAFKNMNLDIRQYRRLRMEVHAEALIGEILQDDELTLFIRIGSDYRGNFYEYEIPLKLTPPGRYNNDVENQRAIVWPLDNKFDIDLSLFQEAKQERNRLIQEPGSTLGINDMFIFPTENARISVTGNPNLSNVRVIMIGVRNPIKTRSSGLDDGLSKSGEIWINELRLSDFIEDGGWAANAHLQARLADLGTLDLVGQTSTPGWGSIDKKVNERSKEEVVKYDISSNIDLGKFFSEESGVRLPVYIGYSESRIKPQYNPLDPDILLDDALDNAATKSDRDSIRSIAEDFIRRKTFTVSNAGIVKRGEKPHFWDPANLSVNYTYNEIFRSNTKTELDLEKNIRGGLNYNFEPRPQNIAPFTSMKSLRSPWFRLIRDFNFYPMPRNLSFRTDLSRYYNETKTRNINNPNIIIEPTFRKDFEWTRFYDIKYDLTRQLKIDFTATNIARIDEPDGGVDRLRYADRYDLWRDSVLVNLSNMGRTTSYHHIFNVNYNIPINKIPLLSWMSANARYGATYSWLAGPLFADSTGINLGNTIKNSNTGQFTAQANLTSLYNKSKYLREVESNTRPGGAQRLKKEYEKVTYTRENVNFTAGRSRGINHNLKTKDITVKVFSADGSEIKVSHEAVSETRTTITAAEGVQGARVVIDGNVEKKRSPLIVITEYFVRGLMGVRNISATYTIDQGQMLPGYMPETQYMGMESYGGSMAPGWPFILGYNDPSFFQAALASGWISSDTLLNMPALITNRESFTLRSTIEPFPSLRIDVNADRRYAESITEYFRPGPSGTFPENLRNRMISGNFSMSVISWGTAFEKIVDDNDYLSSTFETFKNNTVIISRRRADLRESSDPLYNPNIDPVSGLPIVGHYKNGYSLTSREVLVPAFLAAYTKRNPERVTLAEFPSALNMMPNWRINFDGLSRFEPIQRVFRSVNLMHQYRSSYTIGSFTTNLNFTEDGDGISRIRDLQSNFLPRYEMNIVSISEQFSPLINIDLGWKNSLTTRVEWKKSRTITLNMTSNQVADVRNNELIIGMGYRFDDVKIIINSGGGQRALSSDLNLRLDFSVRDNKTIARKLIENVNQPVAGQRIFSIRTTADYVLSDRFNLQIFADHSLNNPFVANTFPTSNTNFGFSLRFTLI